MKDDPRHQPLSEAALAKREEYARHVRRERDKYTLCDIGFDGVTLDEFLAMVNEIRAARKSS